MADGAVGTALESWVITHGFAFCCPQGQKCHHPPEEPGFAGHGRREEDHGEEDDGTGATYRPVALGWGSGGSP